MRKAALSVVLPVLNEEENLPEALASVAWAAEIFLVDSGSTDSTRTIGLHEGARVIEFDHRLGGPKKKAWALANLPFTYEWALFLDADERVTEELRQEIMAVVDAPEHDGYYVDREMIFNGCTLRCYRPDWNLRLFRHNAASIEDLGLRDLPGTGDNEIHEHFRVDGSTGSLSNYLLHEDYRGIGPWIERHNKYATWEAHLYRRWRQEPIGFNLSALRDPVLRNRLLRRLWIRTPGRPVSRFFVWYVVKGGFRDGRAGLLYALLMGWYELIVGLKLTELTGDA